MELEVNAFELKLSPPEAEFAVEYFDSEKDRYDALSAYPRDEFRPISLRLKAQPAIVWLDPPDQLDEKISARIKERLVLSEQRRLSKEIAMRAAIATAQAAGFDIYRPGFGHFQILQDADQLPRLPIKIKSGLECQIWQGPDGRLAIVANWRVRLFVLEDLSNERLRGVCLGERAIEVKTRHAIGRITECTAEEVRVVGRDRVQRTYPPKQITIEPHPSILESIFPTEHTPSISRHIMQMALDLTSDNRRNTRALLDRLERITQMLQVVFGHPDAPRVRACRRFGISVDTHPMAVSQHV